MPKPLPASDFRAIRRVLEPEDFVFPGEELPPSDLIDEYTWHSIMTLPDDVSIRTSNHYGNLLERLHELSGAWMEAVSEDQDPLHNTMLYVHDEFDAVIFNSLHGFYRQAIGCLRNVLELTTFGTYCQVCGKRTKFEQWLVGKGGIHFRKACHKLRKATCVQQLDLHLHVTLNDSIFYHEAEISAKVEGWVSRLYSKLCKYVHSRPARAQGHTNVDMWQSNGPVCVPEAFELTAEMYFETSALCFILVKLGKPNLNLPQSALQLFEPDRIYPMEEKACEIARVAYEFIVQNGNKTGHGLCDVA